MKYTEYFGMKREPFTNDVPVKDLLQLPGTLSVKERVDYILNTGGIMVVTGDVGSGKSTSLRWSTNQYHSSAVSCFYLLGSTGSVIELYKQLCWSMKIKVTSSNKANLVREIKKGIEEIVAQQRSKILIIIDEASLLRTDLLAEIHTITQFSFDSSNLFSLVLSGQNSLLDKLKYRVCSPLASRVITRAHLSSITKDQMKDYLTHHLKIVGIKKKLFSTNAMTAIHQGSGGLLRRANSLSRGSLVACMIDGENEVTEEHVRRSASELI